MKIGSRVTKIEEKQVMEEIEIPDVIYIFVIKVFDKDGSSYLKSIQSDTLDCYIDIHDRKNYHVVSIEEYQSVVTSKEINWYPNYSGKRIS